MHLNGDSKLCNMSLKEDIKELKEKLKEIHI
jgi:hypothetical protein